ncbi:hypothetical protein TVD_06030 [Thioalkalivibrio versutus]|uniref:Putative zinc-ribbon domain-containing protein n=1 Tax=Thioalkalivibrio versutus TaxID=106634 RepID=A0A0G3G142_9GAMM|nr:hypothetical protein TVD_06030 [Thioalkalivibrio versutus]
MRVVRKIRGEDRVQFETENNLDPDKLLAQLANKYPEHELSFVEDPFEPESRAIRIAHPNDPKAPQPKPTSVGADPLPPESQASQSDAIPKEPEGASRSEEVSESEAAADTKACPYCGETIRSVAIKCKHCGSDLSASGTSATRPVRTSPDLGLFLLGVPILAIVLIWGWVANMNLLQSPETTLMAIGIGTLLITAVLASVEAASAGMQTSRQKGTYGPTTWFFLILLLWVVCYPAYLYKRRHYGFANLLVPGLVIGAVYLGSWLLMDVAIVEARAGLQNPFR